MIKKWSLALIVFLLFVAGCSSEASTNKANLEEEIFEKGTKLVQFTYMEVNDEDVPEEELGELLKWYSNKVELEEYASEEEELFFTQLNLIKTKQGLSALQSVTGGTGVSKDEFEVVFKEIEDVFGISYKE